MEIRMGMFAKSKAGHDKNHIYVIINCDNEYVYLADGRIKLLDNPKKKKIKHIQLIDKIMPIPAEGFNKDNLLRNEYIKKAIKDYSLNKEV